MPHSRRRRWIPRKTSTLLQQNEKRRREIRRLFAEALERRILLTTVTSVDPLANSHSAAVSTDVSATFDQSVNVGSATKQSFVVHSARGQAVGTAAVITATGNTVTLNPTSDYFPGELVQASVTAGIKSTGGQAAEPHVWHFRTAVTAGNGLFSGNGQNLGDYTAVDISLGDLDGDGDIDAFVANYSGHRVWLNDGLGSFADSGQRLGFNQLSAGISLGDLDGDGDLDAFVANKNRGNRVWLNNGVGQFTDSGQRLGDHNGIGVSLGDLDGDGDLDAFVVQWGRQGGRIWLNNGGQFSDSGQNLGDGFSQGVSLGDLDGDGDLDAFVATINKDRVWINNGTGSFADSGQSLGDHSSVDVSLGDLDGDGDLDAFVANSFAANRVWLNNGGLFTDSGQSLGNHRSDGVSLGDLDGDGDLDAFVANRYQGNRVWLNNGAVFNLLNDSGQNLGDHRGIAAALGDLDGDGDLDAFVANVRQGNRVWLNQQATLAISPSTIVLAEGHAGVTTFSFTVARTIDTRGTTTVDFTVMPSGVDPAEADDFVGGVLPSGTLVFNDGVSSLPLTINVLGDTVVENDEGFTVRLSNPVGNNPLLRAATVDGLIRNDDNVDLGDLPAPFPTLLADNGPAHVATGAMFGSARDTEADGQPSAAADGDNSNGAPDDEDGVTFGSAIFVGQLSAEVTVTVSGNARLDAWVDFNGDRSFDTAQEQIFISQNVDAGSNLLTFALPADAGQGQTFARFRLSTAGGLAPTGGAADGEVEDHTLTIGSRIATGQFSESGQSLGDHPSYDVSLGDLDGDGDLDAFVADFKSGNRVWLNNGGLFSDSGQSLGNHGSRGVALGDLDGDGDLDAFVANSSTQGQANRVWLNDGGQFSNSGQFLSHLQFSQGVSLGDLDGDGDLDAFVANIRYGNRVWINNGTGSFADSGQSLGDHSSVDVSLGDLDGDGDLDAFVANSFAANRVWLNNGGLFTDSGQSLGNHRSDGVSLGDLDGDGDLDAFVANLFGGNRVWLNNGGLFTDSGQSLGTQDSQAISLGDLDGDGDLDAFVTNDHQGNGVWLNDGAALFNDSGQSLGTQDSQAISLGDLDGDGDLDAFVANVGQGNRVWLNQTLTVTSFTPTASGFVAEFSTDLNQDVLNLYDSQTGVLGEADVVLTGATGGDVTGSFMVDESLRRATFVKAGGPLDADNYTATFRSDATGFVDTGGQLLDGDNNGAPGDNHQSSFAVAEPAANSVTIGIPDFVRGPGQAVNLPADATTGIPLTISDGAEVRNIEVHIKHDLALLTINAATVGAGMPPGATVSLNLGIVPGLAIVTFSSPSDLPAGRATFVNLHTTVPSTDASGIYGRQQVLDLNSVTITNSDENPIPAIADDAVHLVSYFGDTSGNGRINASDAALVARIAALLDGGFSATPLTDPGIVGDITGNGRINPADASRVAQFAALIPVSEIPPIPGGVVIAGLGLNELGPGLPGVAQEVPEQLRADRTSKEAEMPLWGLPQRAGWGSSPDISHVTVMAAQDDEEQLNVALEDAIEELLSSWPWPD